MNVLCLNGSEERGYAKGAYNDTLCGVAQKFFENRKDTFVLSKVADGYDIEEEVSKLETADVLIFQFPVYWFNMPGSLKTYLDDVYTAGRGRIWQNDGRAQGGPYGSGGMMQEKTYMLSTTWNAPVEAFRDPDMLFEGKTVDEAFFMFHKMQQFMGAKPLASFSCHNIVQNMQIDADQERFAQHLATQFP